MKRMKRVTSLLLVLMVIFSMVTNVYASSFGNSSLDKSGKKDNNNEPYSKEEILKLEPYVSVNEKGLFELDYEKAKKKGLPEDLLEGQNNYFATLNEAILAGEISAKSNLEIVSNNENVKIAEDNLLKAVYTDGHWYSCGGGRNTNVTNHWWGYSRYACDCVTQRMAADFNSVSAVSAGIAIVAAYFGALPAMPPGLSSAYFWLLASRLDANSHGRGVFIEMTWALAFDITPQ